MSHAQTHLTSDSLNSKKYLRWGAPPRPPRACQHRRVLGAPLLAKGSEERVARRAGWRRRRGA
eukprot:scaffold43832_cov54-Phaeocystis_antarctica.AAC.4